MSSTEQAAPTLFFKQKSNFHAVCKLLALYVKNVLPEHGEEKLKYDLVTLKPDQEATYEDLALVVTAKVDDLDIYLFGIEDYIGEAKRTKLNSGSEASQKENEEEVPLVFPLFSSDLPILQAATTKFLCTVERHLTFSFARLSKTTQENYLLRAYTEQGTLVKVADQTKSSSPWLCYYLYKKDLTNSLRNWFSCVHSEEIPICDELYSREVHLHAFERMPQYYRASHFVREIKTSA